MRRLAFLILLAATPLAADGPPPPAFDPAPSFWVWRAPFRPHESGVAYLRTGGAADLFWLTAEIDQEGAHPITTPDPAGVDNWIAVVRLAPGIGSVLRDETFDLLTRWCSENLPRNQPRRVQIDYDCPASGLKNYANRLTTLRSELDLAELSVTALASWIDAPGFKQLAAAVDEIVPMFYDLEPDDPAAVVRGAPLPMIDDSTLRWIARWEKCPVRWRSGLPNFQRLSLFEKDGTLVGHHPKWSIDGLLEHPAIKPLPVASTSIHSFQVIAAGTVSGIAIRPGQQLVWRMPDETLARGAIAASRKSGATGIVWFAHPASAPIAWHSVAHLAALQHPGEAKPHPAIEIDSHGAIVLTNHGPGDLPVRPRGEPWQFIIEAPSPGWFGAAGAGAFLTIDAPGSSAAEPGLARKMVLSFRSLRSGKQLRSGHDFVADPDSAPPDWSISPVP